LTMNSSFGPAALACSSLLCHSDPASLPAITRSGCVSRSLPVNHTMLLRLVNSILFGAFGC
jgi:hypothetical protein